MTFLPEWSMSWTNAFWFSALSLVTSFVLVRFFPGHFRKRVFTMPDFSTTWGRVAKRINMACMLTMLFVPLFAPLQFGSGYFIPGVGVYLLGYVFYVMALVNYATTEPGRPVVSGVYRLSRNPQQIGMIIMWTGVGMTTGVMLFLPCAACNSYSPIPRFLRRKSFALNGMARNTGNTCGVRPATCFSFDCFGTPF